MTTGTTSLTPRWDKCVNYVENTLFYATGRLFVNAHFQEDKKHMVRLFCVCADDVMVFVAKLCPECYLAKHILICTEL